MIKFTEDTAQIKSIWQSVFGDEESYIDYFLTNCKHKKCLGYFVDDKLVSMMFLIDCSITNFNGKYIYAASTLEEYRGNGYMSKLIEYTKENIVADFLCLVPAEESLFDYYAQYGFKPKLYSTERKSINEKLTPLSFEDYKRVRSVLADNYSAVNWKDVDYFYNENIYCGGYFAIYNESLIAVRDGCIIECIKDHFSYFKKVGMILSKHNIKDTYIGLFLD